MSKRIYSISPCRPLENSTYPHSNILVIYNIDISIFLLVNASSLSTIHLCPVTLFVQFLFVIGVSLDPNESLYLYVNMFIKKLMPLSH